MRRLAVATGDGRRPAYTLVETIVCLVVIALISLGVAAVLQTAAYGTSSQRESRRVAVRTHQVHARMDDAVRNARAVLAAGNTYLVLWTGDMQHNDQVNLSELQLIELAGGTTNLVSYTPGTLSSDPVYAANADFYSAVQTAKQAGQLVGTPWSSKASGMAITLDGPTPQASRLVTWSLTLADQSLTESVIGSAALRSRGTPQ